MARNAAIDNAGLHVVVLCTDEQRGDEMGRGLKLAQVGAWSRVSTLDAAANQLAQAVQSPPIERCAAFIDVCASNGPAEAELIKHIPGFSCPVAVFSDTDLEMDICALVDAGACTVVVDGLTAKRIPYLLELTVHRFSKVSALRDKLDEARTALEERKTVDRAKGLLMQSRGISEPEAYKLLRQAAMNNGCKVGDVARSIIIANDV